MATLKLTSKQCALSMTSNPFISPMQSMLLSYSTDEALINDSLALSQNIPEQIDSFSLQQAQETIQALANPLIAHGVDVYSNYLAPLLVKSVIDKSITDTITLSAYFSTVGAISAQSFVAKTSIAMGFKVFATTATPFVAQFVESVTQSHILNAKYTYHAIRCTFDDQDCDLLKDLPNPHKMQELDQLNSTVDFNQAYQDAMEGLSKITPQGLLISGIISAAASEFKDFSLEITHLRSSCQGYFCKNWIAYYYKEWIKKEIKEALPGYLKETHQDSIENLPSTKASTGPTLSLQDVLDTGEVPGKVTQSANNAQCAWLLLPLLDISPVEIAPV